MTPSPHSPENPWYQPTEVAYGPTVSQVEELYVVWDGPTFQAQATVVAERGAPVVRAFACEVLDGSLPAEARRLPSDAFVIDAVRRFGLGGIAPLIRLLGEENDFEARYAAMDVPEGLSSLEAALADHGTLIVRRPRAQIQQQIHDVQQMQEKGMRTSEIESELMTRFGLSRRTAYRRIESAREGAASKSEEGE
jgi:hypothetical protein